MDYFLDYKNVLNRLIDEYEQHKSLIVAFDFDNTVYNFHHKGLEFNDVINLLRKCKELDFYLIVFSCNKEDKYEFIINYLNDNNIPFDTINENSPKINFGYKKIYYNILLDDRAGLKSAYDNLLGLTKYIDTKNNKIININKEEN